MDKKKPKTKSVLSKGASDKGLHEPHYYRSVDGVHIFHGTHESHKHHVGVHIENPSSEEYKDAISKAKKKNTPMVMIHGAPPKELLTELSPQFGAIKPGQFSKSEVEPVTLAKAFLQPDKQTMTDLKGHAGSLSAAHPALMKWGQEKLSSLPVDAIEGITLDGKVIKVRKLDSDLYSGWVENNGKNILGFEKVTLPELMIQLQSKLELYGKEESATGGTDMDVHQHIAELHDRIRSHAKEHSFELPEHLFSLEGTDEELATQKESVKKKLQELKAKIQSHAETQVEVPSKDLADGLALPDEECDACENKVDSCVCFTGMPKPRLEFDGKKVTIFFKSEVWSQESQEAFVEDLKRRAGRLLKKRDPRTS